MAMSWPPRCDADSAPRRGLLLRPHVMRDMCPAVYGPTLPPMPLLGCAIMPPAPYAAKMSAS